MKLRKYSYLTFRGVLGIGALLALVLCVQCVRTYLYTDAVLIPQQAEREAERQAGALTTAARSAGITDPRTLGPVIEQTLESSSDHVLWMRILDLDNNVLSQGGSPQGTAKIPADWWNRVEKQENLGVLKDMPDGKAYVAMVPFRIPRPPARPFEAELDRHYHHPGPGRPPGRHDAYVLEIAISLKAVAGAFGGLRQNLIVGLVASVALLVSVVVIGLRAPNYFRGKYLESEMQLARRVQRDLQPKPHSISPHFEFAASAIAADQVGGDFYDIFETTSGKIAIVLGDVSGKGISAALLVSVLQGAIRSATISQLETACERINRMLCERTACERFATLFWGVFDPAIGTLRYVNVGHCAPMLLRQAHKHIERLEEGGPVFGVLPNAHYSAGMVQIENSDTLILYSDGINEAANRNGEEFGEDRIKEVIFSSAETTTAEMCERIMGHVALFASAETPQDDRTLMVVRFPQSEIAIQNRVSGDIGVNAVA